VLDHVASLLGIGRNDIVDSQWVDNGPGWMAVLLGSVEEVLALRPAPIDLDIGVVALYPEGGPVVSRCGPSSRRTAPRRRTPSPAAERLAGG
jgi:predicted PhzF superfamily epimerase YddE/YHI9